MSASYILLVCLEAGFISLVALAQAQGLLGWLRPALTVQKDEHANLLQAGC